MSRFLVILLVFVPLLAVAQVNAQDEPLTLFDAQGAYKMGEYEQAAEIFRKLAAAEDADGEPWYGLGQTLLVLKKHDEAAEAFQRAADLKTENITRQAMAGAARAHAAAGRAAETVEWLTKHATGALPSPELRGLPVWDNVADDPDFQALARRLWPCDVPERRHFDFWVGTWDVKGSSSGATARSEISVIQDGCAVREEYSTAGGYTGTSLNFWDASDGLWHQLWVDLRGAPLRLQGGLENGSMVLRSPDGKDRITWTPRGTSQVRQHWERVQEDGNWSTIFDGVYTRVEGSVP